MEGKMKDTVVLFRSPKEDENDPYETAIKAAGFSPFSIPVLDFNFINLEGLHDHLVRYSNYSGIVLTSPRAVEACSRVKELMKSETPNTDFLDMVCYCVGPATKQLANKLGFRSIGHEAGNADKLAKYIIENKKDDNTKPLLYTCGNLRRDTLSLKLKSEGFTLDEIVVYETVKSRTIQEDVETLIQAHGVPKYVVYFSPSGVQYTSSLYDSGILNCNETKIVAIGNTTDAELKGRGMKVAGVAKTPDHIGVTEALLQASG